ncbi:dienelactone hydrolase [Pseudonocardia dioxanivorans CB1190]|uniref:Dienelactone hydrolase n=1 Tax=Pseudonocardia dioxanivorans (strain ATCC 55486 / DSM 44775 / JCM 13855 / CB1190) TaxID=675635 RepID=F4CZC7_PSEUX|nr:dienelactone hydrolase [Pseudonocardia dioxanivorans CB1190]
MSAPSATRRSVQVRVSGAVLEADVGMPCTPNGAVLFAHGSGSGRRSPRNRYVADQLNSAGLVTVLADLLTQEEEQHDLRTATLRFDIGLLAARVTGVADWMVHSELVTSPQIGIFGASTGAAAALICAATRPSTVRAVVCRGGRPDLAGAHLPVVRQPTLLIVGERDPVVVELNRRAARKLAGEARLEIVPGATHLFEEPGALEMVAGLAGSWFRRYLQPVPADDGRHRD